MTRPKPKNPRTVRAERKVRVLAWTNRERTNQGKRPLAKLPKGQRRGHASCPLARATGYLIYQSTYVVSSELAPPLPKFVVAWLDDFDAGKYPELVA